MVVVFMFIVFGHLYDVCELYIIIGMVPQLYGLLLLDLTVVLVNTVQQWCRDCVDDVLECWGTVSMEIGLDFLPMITV